MSVIDKTRMRRSFDQAAERYDEMAVLQHEVGQRVMERLEYIKLHPDVILDIGAGTGKFAHLLKQKYKKSQVIALDMALSMLHQTKKRNTWFKKVQLLGGDAECLPVSDDSIDMIFSNLTLQWCQHLPETISEWWRVMRPDGLLMFTTLGPDTLKELRSSWLSVDQGVHVNTFIDMHHIGDMLIQAGFADPVMDMEIITLTYPDIKSLLREIKGIGAHNVLSDQHRGLTGKSAFLQLQSAYEQFRDQGVLPVTYEVVYGHAWMPSVKKTAGGMEAFIPLDSLRQSGK